MTFAPYFFKYAVPLQNCEQFQIKHVDEEDEDIFYDAKSDEGTRASSLNLSIN